MVLAAEGDRKVGRAGRPACAGHGSGDSSPPSAPRGRAPGPPAEGGDAIIFNDARLLVQPPGRRRRAGDDLTVLKAEGDKIVRALNGVPGAADVQAQQIAGLPYVRVIIRRDKLARYGINAAALLDPVSVIGGQVVGEVFEGQRRFPLQVRLAPAWREDLATLESLTIEDPRGRRIPLSQLADIVVEDGPAEISRDAIRRRLLIQCNVRGRDLAGFVADAKATVEREVRLPPGYVLEWGGQFENLERASRRLLVAVPVALLLIFSLLSMTFGSVSLTMLISLERRWRPPAGSSPSGCGGCRSRSRPGWDSSRCLASP